MLSVTATYALRALAELAGLPAGATLLGRDLAERAGIPSNYLSKILWSLGGSGMIEAIRGIRGGYRLGRPAREIRLIEVVALFNRMRNPQSCFLYGDRPCSERAPCSAHEAWSRAGAAYAHFLEETTLAGIARRKPSRKQRREA